jgi:hypothetical protein
MQCYENTVTTTTFWLLTKSRASNDEHARCEEQDTAEYAFEPVPWKKAAEPGPEQGTGDRANQKISDEQWIDRAETQV